MNQLVDYEQILKIIESYAKENKSAREVYNIIIFAFGEPKKEKA